MSVTVLYRFKVAGYNASAWTSGTLLEERELGLELDTGKVKLGNGSTIWGSLGYHYFWTTWARIDSKPTTLAGYGITDAQPGDADLTALAAVTGTNTIYYRSAANTWSAVTVSGSLGFSGGTLGSALGTAATVATGTSGATIPLLNAANTWSAAQAFGTGGTGGTAAFFTVNGGSGTNGGGYISFQKNTVTTGYLGHESAVNGGTSNDITLFSTSGVRLHAGASFNITADRPFLPTVDITTPLGSASFRWLSGFIAAIYTGIRTITATASASTSDFTILCNATSGAITVNLPAASGMAGRILAVKKIDVSANTVTIDGNASETIDGATTKVISTQWASFMIQCDGTAWFTV